ncbi:acyl-CoA N-acyltransferase [Cyathus striatus]|nr:acyl-CoA N-acyltransferase [Cyathus striatus]
MITHAAAANSSILNVEPISFIMALEVVSNSAAINAFSPILHSRRSETITRSNTAHHVVFHLVPESELLDAWNIEQECFPVGEADPLEYFRIRQSQAPHLFLGAYIPSISSPNRRKLVGFVCSTQVNTDSLTVSSMSKHDPTAQTVCIHSLCVSKSQRGKGLGVKLFGEYLAHIKEMGYERAVLITHEELIGFYEKAGLVNYGKSDVVYGDGVWFDMRLEFKVDASRPRTLNRARETNSNNTNNHIATTERNSRL